MQRAARGLVFIQPGALRPAGDLMVVEGGGAAGGRAVGPSTQAASSAPYCGVQAGNLAGSRLSGPRRQGISKKRRLIVEWKRFLTSAHT